MPCLNKLVIKVASRTSPLARVQVDEVLAELKQHHPEVEFSVHYVETVGDKDQVTSLRTLDKTDFFTKEIDEALLSSQCRIGIHSAKDLPSPLPEGLVLICLTQGLDSSDALVMRPGMTLDTLPHGARVATSSVRREECVRQLRPDFTFMDLRGTIGQRLQKLYDGETDGVVLAEAALIRLRLTHLNRIKLPGETVAGQGQLAVVARETDLEMKDLFMCINTI